MRNTYRSGGFMDFVEDVLKGAAKGGIDYVDKPKDDKKDDKKASAADKAVDAVKDKVKGAGTKAAHDAMVKYVIIGVVLYVLLKGNRR